MVHGKCHCGGCRAQGRARPCHSQQVSGGPAQGWFPIPSLGGPSAAVKYQCRVQGAPTCPSPLLAKSIEQEMDPLFPHACKSRPALGTLPTFILFCQGHSQFSGPATEHHRPLPPHPVRRTVCLHVPACSDPPGLGTTHQSRACGHNTVLGALGIAGLSNNGLPRVSLQEHSRVLSVAWGSIIPSPHSTDED